MSGFFSNIFRPFIKTAAGGKQAVDISAVNNGAGYHTRGVLFPKQPVSFTFRNVEQGKHVFALEHSDDIAHRLRRSIILEVRIDGKSLDKEDAKLMGVGYDARYGGVINLNFGKFHSGRIQHSRTLELSRSVSALQIIAHMKANRVVNIDHLSLYPEGTEHQYPLGFLYSKSTKDHRTRIKALENKIRHLERALERSTNGDENLSLSTIVATLAKAAAEGKRVFVIYSGIDLNIVDGSSIWVSNITNILSENDFVLVLAPYVLKTDIITRQFAYPENCRVISVDTALPGIDRSRAYGRQGIGPNQWASFIKRLDAVSPVPLYLVLRGYSLVESILSDRYFYGRCILYLTDFYEIIDDERVVADDAANTIYSVSRQSAALLYQTEAIKGALLDLSASEQKLVECPPVLPDQKRAQPKVEAKSANDGIPHIVYAGKIAPNWGVEELLDFALEMQQRNTPVRVTLIANKISSNLKDISTHEYRALIVDRIDKAGADFLQHVGRDEVQIYLKSADFVWCYRPSVLEDNTLELSTKLLEAVALGCRTICYPNTINIDILGEDFPYFASSSSDFESLLTASPKSIGTEIIDRVNTRFSRSAIASQLLSSDAVQACHAIRPDAPTICFAGHDFKFIDPYINYLKRLGYPILRDVWEWGSKNNHAESFDMARRSDIIFCEWGLANAVWHSRNNNVKKPLYIRVHLQEINEKAEQFGHMISINNVTKIIFVSERVKDVAAKMFGWPESKLEVIPNFVLDEEFEVFDSSSKADQSQLTLGMVGIVPSRKRFDRAIDTLIGLRALNYDANLVIKGPRPEDLEFMRAPGRASELEYYEAEYERIAREGLDDHVKFVGWGNDMATWYRDIDFILSPSDFESFHYAVADGVLCGRYPVIWPWSEASEIYPPEWVIPDTNAAVDKIVEFWKLDNETKRQKIEKNRDYVVDRYGSERIFTMLDYLMKLPSESALQSCSSTD